MTDTHDVTLQELSDAECWQLLVSHDVGRISYVDLGWPMILPLNYVVEERTLWFRTASHDQLAMHLPGQRMAFEIDHVDAIDHTGWNVVLRGVAEHALPGFGPPGRHWANPSPWPDGVRTMLFRVDDPQVSGRLLRPA